MSEFELEYSLAAELVENSAVVLVESLVVVWVDLMEQCEVMNLGSLSAVTTVACLVAWSDDLMVDWTVGKMVSSLVAWMAIRKGCVMVSWSDDMMVDWMVGKKVSSLVAWMANWKDCEMVA